jgi:hypothetical protein
MSFFAKPVPTFAGHAFEKETFSGMQWFRAGEIKTDARSEGRQ